MTTAGKTAYKNYKAAGVETGKLPLVENVTALEIGFGTGTLLQALNERGNDVYGVDAGQKIVDIAKGKGFQNVFLLDVSEENLPFGENFFDAVYCYETFEHLANPHRMFVEIRRILKPGSLLFFSVPTQENTMGYGPCRHSFVYPGLLERKNLERFFTQMYFAVEYFAEDDPGLIVHRHYILKNMKEENLPDIIEVIVGDYSIADLYGHVLKTETLDREILKEIEPYLIILETCLDRGDEQLPESILNILLSYYKDFYFVYLRLAEIFLKYGRDQVSGALLETMKNRFNLPDDLSQKVSQMINKLSHV